MNANEYVETDGVGWRVRGSRVSLDSIIYAFRDGLSPEAIARECFPTLTLEQVYGAITAYLAHRAELDAYLREWKERGEREHERERTQNAEFSDRMEQARAR